MINLNKFVLGQVEYKLNKYNIMDFLKTVEKTTNILWQTGTKPTKFIPEFEDYVYISVVGVYKNKPALAYTINPDLINLNDVEEY